MWDDRLNSEADLKKAITKGNSKGGKRTDVYLERRALERSNKNILDSSEDPLLN